MALTEDSSCCEYRGDRRPRKKRWWRLPYERTEAEMMPTKSAKELRSCNVHLESGLRHSKWREPGSASDEASSCSLSVGLHFLRHVFCHGYVRYLLILLLCLECLSSRHVLAGTSEYKQLTFVDRNEICSSIDIRNSVDSFEQLSNCRVIDGFLQIVLMDRTSETDFANLTYPKLREITGYLLLYRVSGLKSLAHIFPNLAVIRGQDLFMNYAIAVYEMLHLEELGLHSLTDIQRGYVIITKNPLLCYVDTIDWSRIIHPNSTTDSNFIAENRAPNACPTCPSSCGYNNQTKQHLCWNAQHCQRTCPGCVRDRCTDEGECCSSDCLGGCAANGSDQCISCEKFVWDNHCVAKCPNDFYESVDRRCISAEECYAMRRPRHDQQLRLKPYKPFDGKCLIECPPNHAETAIDGEKGEKIYTCTKCAGTCRKVCEGASIDSIQAAQRLKGCVVINGSLEIQVRGGGSIVRDLEESLNMVEEITGYLKIVRSLSLVSLNFLRKLKVIRGENLENQKYALVVLDNANLIELWDFSRRENTLTIEQGRIFFHFNPKLCYNLIIALQQRLKLPKPEDVEVAPNSNGDKVACNLSVLKVSIASLRHDMVIITWIPYWHYEMRTLLGYVVYYIEAPHQNITITDGRDGCGNDEWGSIDVDVPEEVHLSRENVTTLIPRLKPYTRYAFYVKTYTIATETNGAQSEIAYFRTYPATPTPPHSLVSMPLSSSEVLIQWTPPEVANGAIEKYIVHGEYTPAFELVDKRNYCLEPLDPEKKDYLLKEEKKKYYAATPPVIEPRDECACTKSMGITRLSSPIRKNDQQVQALIEFENQLHDNIYVKNTDPLESDPPPIRDRRDISHNTEYNQNSIIRLFSDEFYNDTNKNATRLIEEGKNYTEANFFRYEVSNETMQLKISDLKHFSVYSIKVIVCRERVPGEAERAPNRCSSAKLETAQTLPLAGADEINPDSIQWDVANETNSAVLRWDRPNETNGLILTYLIQYGRVDIENQQPQTLCVTSQDFELAKNTFVLKKLPAGNYSVMIKAVSLARDSGSWTPAIHFVVNDSEETLVGQLLLGAGIAVVAIIVLVAIFLLIIRYFYPHSWYHRKLLFATVNPEYFKPPAGYDKWEISRRKITFDSLLGIGHFGEVYEGRARGILQKGVTTKVAIKTLSRTPTNHRTWLSFLNEASVMKQFDTHHVVRLLGVVTKGEPLVIMELMAKGDLRTHLRSCRHDVPDEERKGPIQDPPTLQEILQWAAEIADGMLYLSDKKYVHRDLAARNCMINAENTVKIGDFGLTRDVYETDYYRKDSRGHLPIRWMAPESLSDGIFTSRSDVWSYGVVLWEMATLASLPYAAINNHDIMLYVSNGGTLETPPDCPEILVRIMKQCWSLKYCLRPSFSDVLEMLLPALRPDFVHVSYYHTEDSRKLREQEVNAILEDTQFTPLRANLSSAENFSLGTNSDDRGGSATNHYSEPPNSRYSGPANVGDCDCDCDDDADSAPPTQPMLSPSDGANYNSASSHTAPALPTVNGYIQRSQMNMIPLVPPKTPPTKTKKEKEEETPPR